MSQLEHVIQIAIVGGALAGVLVMGAGQSIADYLNGALRVVTVDVCGWCSGGGCEECDPDQRHDPGEPGPCAWHWTIDGSPCGCDPDDDLAEEYADILDDEVDGSEYDEPDWGDEWDRARDRWLDDRAGAS
ncbi:hypothetical protein [Nocardia cyriacigeorgica]|uniref:hypothetical protein n=1 Tax=Nocardia cyriacigeorgica TaxID=135487 RepID=UPI0013D60063|nr:hypothetical protein [Nocardia cyriacigeorgica]NEW27278.1 hypothetical protein [Nocardia cyriacigeorgica]